MPGTLYIVDPDAGADGNQDQTSEENRSWPISGSALAALVDLGMSDGCIAHYFRVSADSVRLLRRYYGL